MGNGDLLTSYGCGSITYDAIGNPLSYDNGEVFTFTWKNGRQLATASGNGYTLFFNYNDEGIRTSKTVNNVDHTYHLSGTDIIAEEWGNHLIIYLYDSNGSPMGMQYRTSSMDADEFYTFWFEKNLQGDIVAIYNSAGTKLVSYNYDAWGNCSTAYHNLTGTNSYVVYNPFRYRGYYFDSELGFYYLNSRYYNPEWGRFINADVYVSTGQGLLGYNMFAYCNNEPVFHRDSQGTEAESVDIFDDSNPHNDLGKGPNGQNGGSKASQSASKSNIHGNSKQSTKVQHGYEIKSNDGVEKVGVSGQPLNKNGTSPRANAQVNALNRAVGYNKYWAEVRIRDVPGRGQILVWEENMASYYKKFGEPMGIHKRP